MKIKHFAGYGTVNAKKLKKGTTLEGNNYIQIYVYGDHEQSLLTQDIYTLYNWIFKRFEKTIKINNPYTDIKDIYYKWIDTEDASECILYTFVY